MNAQEFLSEVGKAHPEAMQKVAMAHALLSRISPGQADELLEDVREIANYATEKLAAPAIPKANTPTTMDAAVNYAAILGVSALGGAFSSAATDLYDAAKRGLTKGRNFSRIMKDNPQLKEVDPAQLKRMYSTLHRYAPEFTADPNLGGQLLTAMVTSPEVAPSQIGNFIAHRKTLQDAKHRQYSPAMIPFELPGYAAKRDIAAAQMMAEAQELGKGRAGLHAGVLNAAQQEAAARAEGQIQGQLANRGRLRDVELIRAAAQQDIKNELADLAWYQANSPIHP